MKWTVGCPFHNSNFFRLMFDLLSFYRRLLLPGAESRGSVDIDWNRYSKIGALLIALLFAAVATSQVSPVKYTTRNIPNGCHVNATAFRDAYQAQQMLKSDRWARILIIQSNASAHAVCVYQCEGSLWVYDNATGSWKVTQNVAIRNDPMALAHKCRPADPVAFAYFES